VKQKIAIIGAGASGIIAALEASKKDNYHITIFEKNSKIARKLLATGNGRCNITNANIKPYNYHSYNHSFIDNFLKQFQFSTIKQLFNNFGIEFCKQSNNKIFPMSNSAASVVEILKYELKKDNIKIKLNTQIDLVEYKNNRFIINDETFHKVIVATGSLAMKKLGGTDIGYNIAKSFGHTIIEPFASLVQLVCKDTNIEQISGIKLEVVINNKIKGDLLFAKYGLSGSAILDISREYSKQLLYKKQITINIDLMPKFSKEKLSSFLQNRIKNISNRPLVLWLDGVLNQKLSKYLFGRLNLQKQYSKQLNKKDILKLVYLIKNLTFDIVDTKGFDFAEVSAGGIDTTEINLNSFESKLQPNLYFLGELLDIDGDCGGYNLHFAFGSGYICGKEL
jgi:predicted Rossmann fold flavoprotein